MRKSVILLLLAGLAGCETPYLADSSADSSADFIGQARCTVSGAPAGSEGYAACRQAQLDQGNRLEQARCAEWGAPEGSEGYTACRMALAQLGAQQQMADGARRLGLAQLEEQQQMRKQERSQALLALGARLAQESQQPPPRRTGFNCTSTQQGVFTNTHCQ